MSDDTPTERFDPAGDAPTERIPAADTAEVPSEEVVEERKSRRLILILGIIGGLLLIGVIILLVLLLTLRGGGTPTGLPTGSASPTPSVTPSVTPSATPSATPTPTPTPTETQAPPPPPPPSTDVEVTSFDITNPVDCSAQTQNPVYLDISWTSTNGIAAYFGVNTSDAQTNGMGWTLPPNGNNNDFPSGYTDYQFQCGNESITYTITIVGTNGSKDSRSVTVENVGDTF